MYQYTKLSLRFGDGSHAVAATLFIRTSAGRDKRENKKRVCLVASCIGLYEDYTCFIYLSADGDSKISCARGVFKEFQVQQ